MKISKKESKVPTDPTLPPLTEKLNSKVEKPTDNKAKWTYRFLMVSIIQGAIATFLTILLAAFIITMVSSKIKKRLSNNLDGIGLLSPILAS